jgi:Asp-tRNA(Asn)/Glu-tRNA(Gln) amidotransferase A subunit family amidase
MFNSVLCLLAGFAALQQTTLASIVYGKEGVTHTNELFTRSTFSNDSSSSAPQAVSYVNFKDGDIDYLAHIGPNVPYAVQLTANQTVTSSSSKPYKLVTIISAPQDCSSDYDTIVKEYSTDDVWSSSFLDIVYLSSGKCGSKWTSAIKECVSGKGHSFSMLTASVASSASGPYLVLSDQPNHLYPVYRLYTDPQYAFTEGILPVDLPANASQQQFVQSPTGGQDSFAASAVGIPVPSRLYFKQTASKPLAGVRMAIKDIFDIKGLRTGCGNRAYYAHYNAALENSFPVQRFLEKGAILVGKTKASQFANGETSTADWVDQLCPFNARGDGYQDPSSSSSGSGASQGAYDWIDVTVGSDTGGSIRGPAGVNGVLGIRPSTGIISLEGVMPLSDVQDTAGYFARDAFTFAKVGNAFYGDLVSTKSNNQYTSKVESLLVPSDFWEGYLLPSNGSNLKPNTTFGSATTTFSTFIAKLSSLLGDASIEQDAFESLWNASSQGTANGSIDTYLNTTYPVLIGGYQYRVLAQPFIASYSAANGGREPFFDPVPLVRWAFAESVGQEGYQDALDEQNTFTSFIRDQVLPSNCSTLLLYPQSDGTPFYRNNYLSEPEAPVGFGAGRIANLAGVPEIVIPIGQATFNSSITKSTSDSLPVSMSIVGGRNCDGQLLHLASKLEKAGITNAVKVGAATF